MYNDIEMKIDYPTGLRRWILSASDYPPFVTCKCNWCYNVEDHCIDPWSLLHLIFGILIGLTFIWFDSWAILLTFCLALAWEIFENTEWGANIVSKILCSEGYTGDNIWNSIFDVLFTTFGGVVGSVIVMSVN